MYGSGSGNLDVVSLLIGAGVDIHTHDNVSIVQEPIAALLIEIMFRKVPRAYYLPQEVETSRL